jgi:hypothetical protein
MQPLAKSPSPLGSLAQSARIKNLRVARWILIILGALTTIGNAILFVNAPKEVEDAIREEYGSVDPSSTIDPYELQMIDEGRTTALLILRSIYGGMCALGITFIALGVLVYRIPVIATVLGLILYIGIQLVMVVLTGNPIVLVKGWLIKIVIIAGLAKAIQAAIAWQREMKGPGRI